MLGRQKASKAVQAAIYTKKTGDAVIGSEMGVRLKTKQTGAFLRDFNWFISANNFKRIKFRINIYAVKDDLPDTLLSNKQIFGEVADGQTGWLKVDLIPYDVSINGDFIITLQWIESTMNNTIDPVVMMPAGLSFSKNCYARIASQDKWKKVNINLSYFVTLGY